MRRAEMVLAVLMSAPFLVMIGLMALVAAVVGPIVRWLSSHDPTEGVL